MFLKTLKHDLMNSFKDYSMLYLIMILLAVVGPFVLKSNLATLQIILGVFMVIIVTSSFVLMIVNAINFLKRRLFDQGAYLNLTLPVSIETTLISKILTVSIWQFLTLVMIGISLIIFGLLFADNGLAVLNQLSDYLLAALKQAEWSTIVLTIISLLVGSLLAILSYLLCMTIVNTSYFKRPNYFIAFMIFILMTLIKAEVFDNAFYRLVYSNAVDTDNMSQIIAFASSNYQIAASIIYDLVFIIILFLTTTWLFKKKIEL